MTKAVELDINKSDKVFNIEDFRFYFTSDFNLNRFKEGYKEYAETENLKFKLKYRVNINFNKIFFIAFYKKIEKRGFRVYNIITNSYLAEDDIYFI